MLAANTTRKPLQAGRYGSGKEKRAVDGVVPVPDSDYTGKGNANAAYSFRTTWNNMHGFRKEQVLLGMNVAMMHSWTAALATLEEAGKT